MGITVKGVIIVRNTFSVELDMTEEQFNDLSNHEQEDMIASAIDWSNFVEGCDIHDVDVDDVIEETEEGAGE